MNYATVLSIITLAGVLFVTACSQTAVPVAPTTLPEASPMSPTPTPATEDNPPDEQPPTAAPAPTEVAPDPSPQPTGTHPRFIDDSEVGEIMSVLAGTKPGDVPAALKRIEETEDSRFTAVFIELMRAAQIGLVPNTYYADFITTLEAVSGESFGDDWVGWIEWYGATDLEPPPGFTGWKGLLLVPIDPRFSGFLENDAPSRLRVEEIQWGGVPVDGIPALENPPMLTAAEAGYLVPGDAVFGLDINGEAKAYPLRILDWHEMANDEVGGVPVSLAYCTLCGAAIAYDGRASDGNTYTFGSSGFLYRSNKLMFDRQTRTLWNHLTGEPVLGELAGTDVVLDILPVVLTTWEEWQARHPDTLVVDVNTGHNRDYSTGAAYADYFAAEGVMFPVWQRSDLLEDKQQIFAVRVNDVPKAYPIEAFAAEPVINDAVGDTAVVLVGSGEAVELTGQSYRSNDPRTYSAGSDVRAYGRGDLTFEPGAEPGTLLDSEGRDWEITEEALLGPDSQTLVRLPGHLAYWFGWFAFFPETAVYGE